MKRLGRVPLGIVIALATLGTVVIVMVTRGGEMFSPGALNSQPRAEVKLGGVASHAEITACAACHVAPWSRATMATRCLDCHTEVRAQLAAHEALHGMLSEGMQCRSCHTEHNGSHGDLTSLARFDHNCAAFKLTGKHTAVECKSCHLNNVFKGTAQDCTSCHAEPQVHRGRFGTICAECHATTTWGSANLGSTTLTNFNHDLTGFKLTGKHLAVECKSCHVNNVFKGTKQDCVSCHAEPKVHLGRFGTACAQCHSTTTWAGAALAAGGLKNFNHDLTGFKLTGKHSTADCKSCHVNNLFKATKQTCVSCHAEPAVPQVHKARYGTECAQCHTTTTFAGATFKHTFPLNHGRKNRTIECTTCHKVPDEFKTYTCYGCHEHEPARIARKHSKIANFDNCVKCHPTGREHERRGSRDEGPGLDLFRGRPGSFWLPSGPGPAEGADVPGRRQSPLWESHG